jgi:hypothetical protein
MRRWAGCAPDWADQTGIARTPSVHGGRKFRGGELILGLVEDPYSEIEFMSHAAGHIDLERRDPLRANGSDDPVQFRAIASSARPIRSS